MSSSRNQDNFNSRKSNNLYRSYNTEWWAEQPSTGQLFFVRPAVTFQDAMRAVSSFARQFSNKKISGPEAAYLLSDPWNEADLMGMDDVERYNFSVEAAQNFIKEKFF